MSKKPYIIEKGSNNIVIVPTENYEPSPKKVKLNLLTEKVPVQQKHGSAVKNARNKLYPGGLSINNNVLIDVSKVKRQQNSWAANFLESIGGTSAKPPRLYHNLTPKPTSLPKENTPNICKHKSFPQAQQQPEEHAKVNEINSSKLATHSNAKTVSTRTEYNAAIKPKVNKDERHPSKLAPYPTITNKGVPKIITNKLHSKPLQDVLQISKYKKNPQAQRQPEEHAKVNEINSSKLVTRTNVKTISTRPVCNAAIKPKVNKDQRDPSKVAPYPTITNKGVTKIVTNKLHSKPLQDVLQICKETYGTQGKRAPLKIKAVDNIAAYSKAEGKIKQRTSNTEFNNQTKAHKITIQGKVNKEATTHKTSKGITKPKTKKESSSAISLMSNKYVLKKEGIVLNLKKDRTSEKKSEHNKNIQKESLIVHQETSLYKEFIKNKSPIKSVVKKINNNHLQDSNTDCSKISDNNPFNSESIPFTGLARDLRSKLKRKYPKNDIRTDEKSRDSKSVNNMFSTVPKSKAFVPNENLIISFDAESDNDKEMSRVKSKKQQVNRQKCKKIKFQINIIVQNGKATDDESTESENEEDDESILENTDVSFLDDFNIDEIVESLNLNDCKSSKEKTSGIMIDNKSSTREIFVENMDTTNEDIKLKTNVCFVENDVDKDDVTLQTNTQNQRTSFLSDCAKIEDNDFNAISENEVKIEMEYDKIKENMDQKLDTISNKNIDLNLITKEEKDYFPDAYDKCHEPLEKSSTENIYSSDYITVETTKKEQENLPSMVQTSDTVNKCDENPHIITISNHEMAEPIVASLKLKTTELIRIDETHGDVENGASINDNIDNYAEEVIVQPVEIVTVDLTNTNDDSLPQIESEDVVIIDIKVPDMIKAETEPCLTLDTDYDISGETKSSQGSDVIKNAINETIVDVVKSTDENAELIKTVVHATGKKVNDGHENSKMILHIEEDENSTEGADQNLAVNKKPIPVTDQAKSNKTVTKETQSKSENSSPKIQPKTQTNAQALTNNNKTMTKNNELQKHANETVFKNTLARRLEARMAAYLGEKYHITKFLHSGRFSTFYLYEDKDGRKNTIKVLKNECDRYNLGILKENMLFKLQSGVPDDNLNCIRLLNGFSMSGRWCFLMEYYPKNLHQVLENRERCFHIDEARRLSAQLVSAVMILRNNNIIHADIKPTHILLNSEETKLKLCGFDQAFYYDNSILLPNVGTVNYRAPELIMGYPADYSIDVWSTALVMYQMVTKRMLFPGYYNNDMLYKHLCTLDEIPFDMLLNSRFRNQHFMGNVFMRVVGPNGEHKQMIMLRDFIKKERIHNVIFQVYSKEWYKSRAVEERMEDKAKLRAFSDLLKQMLVIHPKHRIAIEFVFANPFMYETFDV